MFFIFAIAQALGNRKERRKAFWQLAMNVAEYHDFEACDRIDHFRK
jgi:hypothetical protein